MPCTCFHPQMAKIHRHLWPRPVSFIRAKDGGFPGDHQKRWQEWNDLWSHHKHHVHIGHAVFPQWHSALPNSIATTSVGRRVRLNLNFCGNRANGLNTFFMTPLIIHKGRPRLLFFCISLTPSLLRSSLARFQVSYEHDARIFSSSNDWPMEKDAAHPEGVAVNQSKVYCGI